MFRFSCWHFSLSTCGKAEVAGLWSRPSSLCAPCLMEAVAILLSHGQWSGVAGQWRVRGEIHAQRCNDAEDHWADEEAAEAPEEDVAS